MLSSIATTAQGSWDFKYEDSELRYKVNKKYTLALKNDISVFTFIEAGSCVFQTGFR